jgi:FkbH-like protein
MRLWETFRQKTNAIIIQNNFDIPETRLLGNMELRVPGSQSALLQALNSYMAQHLPDYVLLHDLEYLSSYYGKRHFFDPRFYHYSKQVCSFEVLPAYAASLSSIVRATSGLGYKCLVLDLDNTLWGGVIGDDGIDRIVIGEGKPEGEAYLALQQYAKQLKDRGVLLAVCSKNDAANAKEPFLSHPDMVLHMNDIACFVANWDPKPDNLRRIAQELNIGIDSLVFVDDNPAERAIVRQMLPQVTVVELPEDPSLYVRALVEGHYFEAVTFSEEDRFRTDFYLENRSRDQLAQEITNVDEFLRELDMVAIINPFNDIDLDRIAQLISRSNQFNLTTRRYNRADLATLMQDATYVTRSIRLKDKFGDNGLIGVWIGRVEGDVLDIDTWLMSCRVLSRGVEQHLLNHIILFAQAHGIRRIKGTYIPTSKNGLVREHYAKLGFTSVSDEGETVTRWELPIDAETPLLMTYIRDAEIS